MNASRASGSFVRGIWNCRLRRPSSSIRSDVFVDDETARIVFDMCLKL